LKSNVVGGTAFLDLAENVITHFLPSGPVISVLDRHGTEFERNKTTEQAKALHESTEPS
jgi:hypothetical protein